MCDRVFDRNPDREWRWDRYVLTSRVPSELVRKLLLSGTRRTSRVDGPSPSDRPICHTERPVAAAAS